ncbi:MAG: hypothetical protein MHMPM18_004769 [Marteilia pararefringens]
MLPIYQLLVTIGRIVVRNVARNSLNRLLIELQSGANVKEVLFSRLRSATGRQSSSTLNNNGASGLGNASSIDLEVISIFNQTKIK